MPRGKGFRNQCHACWAATQRDRWADNRDACLIRSKANYQKHASKRRAEAVAYKAEHRDYYTLAEWFRKKGIPISEISPGNITALVEMKKAIKAAKTEVKQHNNLK